MDIDRLIAIAKQEADRGFASAVDRLVEAARGDASAVSTAANALASNTQTADSTEHVAFTYLAAAFKRVADARSSR